MCGIIGLIEYKQGFYTKDKELFQDLLIVNSLRGAHSTGVFGGKMNASPDYAKAVGNPYDFINHPNTTQLWTKMIRKYKYMVGHGRSATRGKVNTANAHPFQVDNITMVHNGTIFTSDTVKANAHEVDSMAIAHALTEHTPQEVFSDINGAFAVVWHDTKTNRLSMVRNDQRPLAIGINQKDQRIVFASEKNMLELVSYRKGIEFDKIFYIPENTIFSWDQHNIIPEQTEIKKKASTFIPKVVPNTTVVKEYQQEARIISVTSKSTGEKFKLGDKITFSISDIVPFASNKGQHFSAFGFIEDIPEIEINFVFHGKEEDIYKSDTWIGTLKSINSVHTSKEGLDYRLYLSEVTPFDLLKTFDGTLVTLEEFENETKNGCASCGDKIWDKDSAKTLLMNGMSFCHKCSATTKASLESFKKIAEKRSA